MSKSKHVIVDALANTRGVHHVYEKNQYAIDQGSGTLMWIVIAGVALAIFCRQPAQPEPKREQLLSMCVLGVCL